MKYVSHSIIVAPLSSFPSVLSITSSASPFPPQPCHVASEPVARPSCPLCRMRWPARRRVTKLHATTVRSVLSVSLELSPTKERKKETHIAPIRLCVALPLSLLCACHTAVLAPKKLHCPTPGTTCAYALHFLAAATTTLPPTRRLQNSRRTRPPIYSLPLACHSSFGTRARLRCFATHRCVPRCITSPNLR